MSAKSSRTSTLSKNAKKANKSIYDAVLVAGMHRSGTSITARLLGALGFYLGNNLIPSECNNPLGFFEDGYLMQVNQYFLACTTGDGDHGNVYSNAHVIQAKQQVFNQEGALEYLEKNHFLNQPFVFKDPRLCLTLPLWTSMLREQVKSVACLIPFRNPLSVAQSLQKRNAFSLEYGLSLWFQYTITLLNGIQNTPFYSMNYDVLLDNPDAAIKKLSEFLSIDPTAHNVALDNFKKAFLTESLRHHQNTLLECRDACSQMPMIAALYEDIIELSQKKSQTSKELEVLTARYSPYLFYSHLGTGVRTERYQIFLDTGNGFSEEDSLTHTQNREQADVTFTLPHAMPVKTIRFDPSTVPCFVDVTAHAQFLNGESSELPMKEHNALKHEGKSFAFHTNDSQITYDCGKIVTSLRFSVNFKEFGEVSNLLSLIDADRNAFKTEIARTQADLTAAYAESHALRGERETLQANVDATQAHLQHMQSELLQSHDELSHTQADLAAAYTESHALREEHEAVQVTLETTQAQLQHVQGELLQSHDELSHTQADLAAAYTESHALRGERDNLLDTLNSTHSALCHAKKDVEKAYSESFNFRSEWETLQAEFSSTEAGLRDVQHALQLSQANLAAAYTESHALRSQNETKHTEVDALRASLSWVITAPLRSMYDCLLWPVRAVAYFNLRRTLFTLRYSKFGRMLYDTIIPPSVKIQINRAWSGSRSHPYAPSGVAHCTQEAKDIASKNALLTKKNSVLKILFITHDCSRTGAPIFLLTFLKWLKSNSNVEIYVVSLGHGPLEKCFTDNFPFLIYNNNITINDITNFCIGKPAIIYGNTVIAAEFYELLAPLNAKVITNVHELDNTIQLVASKETQHKMVKYTSHYITDSNPVRNNLIDSYGILQERILLVYPFIPVTQSIPSARDKKLLREKYNITEDACVILGCGTRFERKGVDILSRVIDLITDKTSKNIVTIWVGSSVSQPSPPEIAYIEENSQMVFVESQEDIAPYYAIANIFALPSREDPFPLVCLHAAAASLPIVCFAGAGGMPDLVQNDAGLVVPYLDEDAFANALLKLIENPTLRKQLGDRANSKFLANHTDSFGAPLILECIQTIVGLKGNGEKTVSTYEDCFDLETYCIFNKDVINAKLDPFEHFTTQGNKDFRVWKKNQIDYRLDLSALKKYLPTYIIFSHELSLTGAPITAYNIAKGLSKKSNIIFVALDKGYLEEYIKEISLCYCIIEKNTEINSNFVLENLIEHIAKNCYVDFAYVNDIECREALPFLKKFGIPSATLVHNFMSNYPDQDYIFKSVCENSNALIFSCDIIKQNAYALSSSKFETLPEYILPQGHEFLSLAPNTTKIVQKDSCDLLQKLKENKTSNTRYIIGVGSIIRRKNIEAFINCAAKIKNSCSNHNTIFLWAGSTSNCESNYLKMLHDDIVKHDLIDEFIFLDEVPNIEELYSMADVLLCTSRLDPLPCVIIGAMYCSLPVVLFDKTSGFSSIFFNNNFFENCVARYLDTEDMSEKVINILNSQNNLGSRLQKFALNFFSLKKYTYELDLIAKEIIFKEKSIPNAHRIDSQKFIIDKSFANFDVDRHLQQGEAWSCYCESLLKKDWARKPFPFFNPLVYAEKKGILKENIMPVLEYINLGRPEGDWSSLKIVPDNDSPKRNTTLQRTALHIHAHYLDVFDEIYSRLLVNCNKPDLYITSCIQENINTISSKVSSYRGKIIDVSLVPNRGRNIGPFLSEFCEKYLSFYEIVGHVHTKRSKLVNNRELVYNWQQFLYENLLSGKYMMVDEILEKMRHNTKIGIVFPDDPHIVSWNENLSYAEDIAKQCGIALPLPEYFNFPVGAMFWARVDALSPLTKLHLRWDDYPAEPIPYDGTILHAIERLFPFVVESVGYKCAITYVPGVSR